MNLRTETNPERLRQAALTLEADNRRLLARIGELQLALARAKGVDNEQAQLEMAALLEQLGKRNREQFGSSSEKRPRSKTGGDRKPKTRKKFGPTPQPELPRVEEIHELDDADRMCPQCGDQLVELRGQFEESEEIDVVECSYQIKTIKRQKYRCRCGGCLETAPGPTRLLPGGRYSTNFAVQIAVGKYADHLPLERQVRMMARAGLDVTSQALWDQLWALYAVLAGVYGRLGEFVRRSAVIGADETRWRLMGKDGSVKWWVWTLACADAIYHELLPHRDKDCADHVLSEYGGVVVADGYAVYSSLRNSRSQQDIERRKGPVFELASCWAHVRRKFFEAAPDHPAANEALDLIGKLYAIEAELRAVPASERRAETLRRRDTESREVVAELRRWMRGQNALPSLSLGRAIAYADGIWAGLVRFLDNPDIPLDNNQTERAIRPVALGRKNHYGSRSERGTQVAAALYSLIESAQLCGVDPSAYLRKAVSCELSAEGSAPLPHEFAATSGQRPQGQDPQ